jgi:hypothetical protein
VNLGLSSCCLHDCGCIVYWNKVDGV